jgi:uncharacterized membrane protein YfcA
MEENFEESSLRLQIILGVGGSIIGIAGGLTIIFVATNLLGFRPGAISLLSGVRVLMILMYAITIIPFATLGEYWWSQMKKRSFKPKNMVYTSLFLGACLAFMALLSFIFELLLPGIDTSTQALVLAISGALAILIPALIARTPKVRKRLIKLYS